MQVTGRKHNIRLPSKIVIFGNITSLLYNYRVGDVTIANSTLYNMEITVKNGASKVDIHDCTLVGLTATVVENSDSWKLNNSIVACFAVSGMDNFAYNAGNTIRMYW